MSQGRCAGCGHLRRNSLAVREHTRYCPQFAALHAEHPEQALEPEAEFTRWVAEQRSGERAARRDAAVTEADRRRAEQKERWKTPPDILGET
jgi:hypothetical protein